MTSPLHISEAVSLALHAMVCLAAEPGTRRSARELAQALGASEAHLAKVLQRLGHEGLVLPLRGPKGGYALAKAPEEITLLAVYQAVEGLLDTRSCLLARPVCGGACILGGLLERVGREVAAYLGATRLSDLRGVAWCAAGAAGAA